MSRQDSRPALSSTEDNPWKWALFFGNIMGASIVIGLLGVLSIPVTFYYMLSNSSENSKTELVISTGSYGNTVIESFFECEIVVYTGADCCSYFTETATVYSSDPTCPEGGRFTGVVHTLITTYR